ncbi:FAD/NAD(P)-binding protein [Actinokineospora bangkokensis]|uniref:FAD-dependent urate hydroxylase HpyO/Asp monooxygenase CreE-like FAD/NAD(P)-binding domain-containing protein n=1 Tax=Actinokineospora bangkokensis TaxID=1193682 RepID=A0A1Q9LLD2_9PSEU|nr:FAD/NAD(P)-binding protein [Actinokineospora bangkokensis]OLR92847.1 hypothetical protein BJP25_19710 [Actinokineospora bangkokensis]
MSRPVLAVVGAGPRGTGLLERLAANADLLDGRGCEVHVVDPRAPGAGHVWRAAQSPLLLMNSRAGEVTMFTDGSVDCAGPVRPGPTLAEWAAVARPADPELAAEAAGLTPSSFATRRLAGEYLRWCFDRAVAALPDDVRVVVHPAAAVGLADGERQRLTLSDGTQLDADIVLLAQGNPGGHRTPEQAAHQAFAAGIGGVYIPPACPGDEDLDRLPAGEPVIVSGLGLAFVDLVVLLTEGRGGKFVEDVDGVLRYEPSGHEPVLHAGSRRGVPYLPKPTVPARRHDGPRFFTPDFVVETLRTTERAQGVLVVEACRELVWAHYRELLATHPERVRMDADEFAAAFAAVPVTNPGLQALVEQVVPDPDDRPDLSFLRSPLTGQAFADQSDLDGWLCDRLSTTVHRATAPRHSAHAAVLHGLADVSGVLEQLIGAADRDLRAQVLRLSARISRFGAFLGSGPPPHRLAQLRALVEAGGLHFLGADLVVAADGDAFTARTASLPEPVRARHLVEARLPDPDARSGIDPLLAGIAAGRAQVPVTPDTFQVLDEAGRPHPRRLAMGLFAGSGALGSFSRPGTNAPFFQQNDATARRLLHQLARC